MNAFPNGPLQWRPSQGRISGRKGDLGMEAGAFLNSRDAHQVSTLPTAPTKAAPVVALSVERESAGLVFQSEIQHESAL